MRVAVVLGAAVWPDGVPSPTLERRAMHAAELWRTGRVGAVLGCGGIGRHPPAEAEVIVRLCRSAGVPETAIHGEFRSTTTRENLTNSLPILREMGAEVIVIVTDAYHAPRAWLIARQLGLTVVVDGPPWTALGRQHLMRKLPREVLAVLATLLRLS